jgi:pimeloyl-ACP methyl ester carboxylesterase
LLSLSYHKKTGKIGESLKPITTRSFLINGNEIAYYVTGEGDPILLVHGITTYSFIWRKVIPYLEKKYQVIAVDLLGCGASSKNIQEAYSIKYHAQILKQLVEHLGFTKIHFVGHDVGGGIGQVFAVDYQDMLYDLTLINSVAYDFWPVQPIITLRTPIIRQMAMATLDIGALRLIVKRGLYHKERLNDELLGLFWKPMKTKQGRKAFLHFAASLDNKHLLEIQEQLHNIDIPVLVIRGDADPYLSKAIADKLCENIPNATLLRVSTGSHFIQEDEPEIIASHLNIFFSSHSPNGQHV